MPEHNSPQDQELESLRSRVSQLEAELALLKQALGLPAAPLQAPLPPLDLTVSRLRLARAGESVCGSLCATERGGSLLLAGQGEKHTLVAAASDQGAVMAIHDGGAEPRASMAASADMTIFRSRGPGEQPCEVSLVGLPQQASVDLQNPAGAEALRLLCMDGAGWIMANDAAGETRATLCAAANGGTLQLSHTDHPRAVLASAGPGGGQVAMQHGKHTPQLLLAAGEGAANVSLLGPGGQVTAALENTPQGGRVLAAAGDGTIAGHLAAGGDGGALAVCGPDGKVRGAMWSSADGAACDLYGQDGTRRIGLKAGDSGGQMGIMSDSGSPRVALGVARDHGHCILSASGGDPALVASATDAGGRLVFCDADGEEVLTLPEPL